MISCRMVSNYPQFALGLIVALFSVPAAALAADAAPAARPNILLAIADDWGFGHASAYGCQWTKTPGFDRVAREGLLFTHAYTPNAKCAPSRACLLTGRNSWQLEAACNHICFFPAKFKTYAEALAEHGYFVGKTTKGWGPGVANDDAGQAATDGGPAFERTKSRAAGEGHLQQRLRRQLRRLSRSRSPAGRRGASGTAGWSRIAVMSSARASRRAASS